MPLIPPKTTRVRAAALGADDNSVTRVQDATGNALDRLLKFVNTAFAQGNNALTVLLPTTFSRAVTYAGDVALKGALTVAGTTSLKAVTGTDATFTGTGSFAGGIQRGNRFMGYRGYVESNAIAGSIANVTVRNVENSGGSIAQVNVFYQTPFAGSFAGLSIKVYNNAATAGSITLTTTGATTNLNNAYTFTQVNANIYQTYTPGAFPYAANSQINFLVSSSAWAQAGGGIDIMVWFYE